MQARVVTRWNVLPWDLDLFGHLTNSRYSLLMDFARVHYLRRAGLLRPALMQRWMIPVSTVNLDFHRPLRPFDKFEIHTQLLSWDDRWIFMRQTFQTPQSPARTLATGYVKTTIRCPSGLVAPPDVVEVVCGRAVAPPELTDDLRVRFGMGSGAAGERKTPITPFNHGQALGDSRRRAAAG